MAEYSREKIGSYLQGALAHPVTEVLYTSRLNNSTLSGYRPSRIFLCLEGAVHLKCSINNGPGTDLFLKQGQVLYASPQNQVIEKWDSAQKMLAIIFPEDIIRFVYIDHDGISPPPLPAPNPTCFYHVMHKLNPAGQGILTALNHIALEATPEKTLPGGSALITALLQNVWEDFITEQEDDKETSQFVWNEIFGYVAEHFTDPMLSREMLSSRYNVHVTYISRKFQQTLGISFTEYVNNCRFDLAIKLLKNPVLRVKEIATACGFSDTSYFIRSFRERFNITPVQFRNSRQLPQIIQKH